MIHALIVMMDSGSSDEMIARRATNLNFGAPKSRATGRSEERRSFNHSKHLVAIYASLTYNSSIYYTDTP